MSNLEKRAAIFAKRSHEAINQKRKFTGEDYIVHPRAVADYVRHCAHHTEEMLAAAWLHDTVEDTGVTLNEIGRLFGDKVRILVEMLTDASKPEDGPRAVRKQIDLEHTAKASPEAKTIKLADLLDNTRSIVKHDKGFAVTYLKEKRALLEVLKEGDAGLWAAAKASVEMGEALLLSEEKT